MLHLFKLATITSSSGRYYPSIATYSVAGYHRVIIKPAVIESLKGSVGDVKMARLSLLLFGSPHVTLDSEPVTRLKHDKVRALLAYLAVESGRPHRRDSLIGLLWPDYPQAAARNSLRQALTILRHAIGDQKADPPYLLVSRSTLQFNEVADYWLDVAAFRALLAVSGRHRHRRPESCTTCARRLEQAAALYQGHFLDGFFLPDSAPFEEWALLARESLRLKMLEALGHLIAYHRQRRQHQEALSFARRQLALDPLREDAHRQVMRLYFLDGERSAALSQYEDCRRLLATELSVEPEPETSSLYEEIRKAGRRAAEEVAEPPEQRPHLPTQPTPFVGRTGELAEIGRLLDEADCRLLTVTGPGGIGKTRLALQAAAEQEGLYAGGVYFVPLASLPSPSLLPEAIADALQLELNASDEPASQVLAALRLKEVLLVLDNFEHLLEGALLLASILRQAPLVNLLVTSRERLDLRGEWTLVLDGLPAPDPTVPAGSLAEYAAVVLFVQSARRARLDFSLTERNGPHIAHICRMVAGLPLAIELAAAWARTFSCKEIAQELERSFALLESRFRDMPARHRSMQAVFHHSWNRLALAEQDVLARLSVFRGGFEGAAAGAVAGATQPLLDALVQKSLLQVVAAGRYGMHTLLRQYAAEKLAAGDSLAAAQTGHLSYYVELAERTVLQGDGGEQIETLDRLETENDNLRAALGWALSAGQAEQALRLAVALYHFWYWRTHYREGRQWLEAALAQSQSPPDALRAQALRAAGVLALELNDDTQAEVYLQESLVLYRQLGDLQGVAAALNSLGAMAISLQEYERAILLLEESLEVRRRLGDSYSLTTPLNNLGLVALAQGDCEQARDYFEEALSLDRAAGDALGEAISLGNLAASLLDQGHYAEAQANFQECLLLFEEVGDKEGSAECLEGLAAALAHQEMNDEAARLWGAAEALRERTHAPVHPGEEQRHNRTREVIEERLDETAFAATADEGRGMSLEQAVRYALSVR